MEKESKEQKAKNKADKMAKKAEAKKNKAEKKALKNKDKKPNKFIEIIKKKWLINGTKTAILVVALVAIFVVLWNKCDWFRNFWIGLWEKIKNAVSQAVENIKKFLDNMKTVIDGVKNNISIFFENIKNFISQVANNIKNFIESVKLVLSTIVTFIDTNVIQPIKNAIQAFLNWF